MQYCIYHLGLFMLILKKCSAGIYTVIHTMTFNSEAACHTNTCHTVFLASNLQASGMLCWGCSQNTPINHAVDIYACHPQPLRLRSRLLQKGSRWRRALRFAIYNNSPVEVHTHSLQGECVFTFTNNTLQPTKITKSIYKVPLSWLNWHHSERRDGISQAGVALSHLDRSDEVSEGHTNTCNGCHFFFFLNCRCEKSKEKRVKRWSC